MPPQPPSSSLAEVQRRLVPGAERQQLFPNARQCAIATPDVLQQAGGEAGDQLRRCSSASGRVELARGRRSESRNLPNTSAQLRRNQRQRRWYAPSGVSSQSLAATSSTIRAHFCPGGSLANIPPVLLLPQRVPSLVYGDVRRQQAVKCAELNRPANRRRKVHQQITARRLQPASRPNPHNRKRKFAVGGEAAGVVTAARPQKKNPGLAVPMARSGGVVSGGNSVRVVEFSRIATIGWAWRRAKNRPSPA